MNTGTRNNCVRVARLLQAAALALALAAPAAGAQDAVESSQRIRAEAESFLMREARGLPGETRVEIGAVDGRLKLAQCNFLQAFFPTGSRAWGKTTVGVRCPGAKPWTVYVPARVQVFGTYLISARGLSPGEALQLADVVERQGDLTALPSGVLTAVEQTRGRTVSSRIAGGQPLREDMLRAEKAVRNGQSVAVVAQGQGFRVSTEGRALGDAALGHLLQVRTETGTVVSGVVRPGPFVEILR
jgi:flagellar basal body P-ring formation protein FlgA